jgi:hypothetical protein
VTAWEKYTMTAKKVGAFESLKRVLVQLQFPIREEGRLHNYRGQPSLSDGAFKILQSLIKAAAENLEYFDASQASELKTANNQVLILVALTDLTLEELASKEGIYHLRKTIEHWQKILCSY